MLLLQVLLYHILLICQKAPFNIESSGTLCLLIGDGFSPRKELDGWDPEDDPWAEHVSHAKVLQTTRLNFFSPP